MEHMSDLKHASVARVRAKDKENEARKDAKVAEDEMRLAREELQAVKIAALEQARQEALKTGNSVEHLTMELGKIQMALRGKRLYLVGGAK